MILALALSGLPGGLVCLGADGHVDIGGPDLDCCHGSSDCSPVSATAAALDGPGNCCIDIRIVVPALRFWLKDPRADDDGAGRPAPDQPALVFGPLTACETGAEALIRGPTCLDGAPPPLLHTTVLQL